VPTDQLNPILPQHIDATMLTCFRSCPRKFFNEFVLGLRPVGLSIDLHAGGAFAHAVDTVRKEVFMNGRDVSEALIRANAAFEIYWGDFRIPEHKKTSKQPDRVWTAVEKYFTQWAPLTDHIQPYFVAGKPTFEFSFAIPLDDPLMPRHPVTGDPFIYAGRFDMLGEYLKRPVICDDKTMGQSPGTNWSERWDLRSQFIGYSWACKQLGIDADDVVVRGVGILMRDINLAEAIKPYSDFLRSRWCEQLRRDLWRIVECWRNGWWDYNLGETCTSYGICPYSTACQSVDAEPWLKTFDVKRWNPVSINPVGEAA
jgi:hypothetical protein